MDTSLDGRTALITGGSRGIGLAIAAALAREGAQVMIVSRKEGALVAAAEQIGHGARWMVANAGNPEEAEAAVDATLSAFGSLDILVNNAAANPYAGPMIEVDGARWDKTIQVNLTAPLVWTQLAWTRWMADHGGSVINVSSVGAAKTSSMLGVYGMTKAALLYQTRQLAAELGPGVRVNAICPGLVKTDFARALWEDGRGDQVARSYPLGRLGEPEDIANAAVYLASDASSWMTGNTMIIDGGGLVNVVDG